MLEPVRWLGALRRALTSARRWLDARRWPGEPRSVGDALWAQTLADFPFLAQGGPVETMALRHLVGHFLARKQFHGAHGWVVTDAQAVAIAAQACLPVLRLAGPEPARALGWYDDFVGIVVHPAQAVAQRSVTDAAGVVHQVRQPLAGEAMDRGPVMLSWEDVAQAGVRDGRPYNVVIHEFAHKLDLRDGHADGCPPLPPGFMGARTGRAAREAWHAAWQTAYDGFREQALRAERFGQRMPWLDTYAAQDRVEFFAVACEAWFTDPTRFTQEFPSLAPLLARLFGHRVSAFVA
jgi:MtfA peptidase